MKPPCVTVSVDGGKPKTFSIDEGALGDVSSMLLKYSVAGCGQLPPVLFVLVRLPCRAKSIIGRAMRNNQDVRADIDCGGGWSLACSRLEGRWTFGGKPVADAVMA